MKLSIRRLRCLLMLLPFCLTTDVRADAPSLHWKRDIGFSRVVTVGHIGRDHKLAVIAATDNGAIYALSPKDGSALWKFQAGDQNMGCPAIADVDADGSNEVIVGASDATLYVLSGDDGRVKWRFKTGGAITGAPAVAHLSRGSKLPEIVVTTNLGEAVCLRGDGKRVQWEKKFARPLLGGAAIADVDGDRRKQLDVVVMTDDGNVTVLEGFSGNEIASYSIVGGRASSPVMIDLNRDNKSEVISAGQRLEAFGNTRSGWGSFWTYAGGNDPFNGSPALGDLDGSGNLAVVALSRDGVLHCVNASNGKPRWTTKVSTGSAACSGSPIIADITGSRKAAVIVCTAEGNVVAVGDDGKPLWTIALGGYADMSPAIFSAEGGKTLDVIVSDAATRTVRAYSIEGGGQIFWGKDRGDAANTGNLPNALAFGNVLRGLGPK